MYSDQGLVESEPVRGGQCMAQHPWHVYLLECEDGSYYAGIAKDVCDRFVLHQRGKGAAYTRSHPPLRVLASREYPSMGAALRAEYALKQLRREDKLAFFNCDELWADAPAQDSPAPC